MAAAPCAPVPVDEPAPVPIVLYTPSQLFVDGDPARGFRGKTTGTLGTTTWTGLVRLLSRAPEGDPKRYPDPNVQKSARGGWSACALKGGRRLASAFGETRLLGLDIDKNGDIEKALEAFAPFRKIVHGTYKSIPISSGAPTASCARRSSVADGFSPTTSTTPGATRAASGSCPWCRRASATSFE
jgi:hypothetical protein